MLSYVTLTQEVYIKRFHLPHQSVCMIRYALRRTASVRPSTEKNSACGLGKMSNSFQFNNKTQICLARFKLEFNRGRVSIKIFY